MVGPFQPKGVITFPYAKKYMEIVMKAFHAVSALFAMAAVLCAHGDEGFTPPQ